MSIKYLVLFTLFMFQFSGTAQEKIPLEELVFYDGVQVYPNPATDHITISYGFVESDLVGGPEQLWIDFENKGLVDILSSDGKSILQNFQLSKEHHSTDIPIHELTNGVYFVVIRLDDEEPMIQKIVKL